MRPFSFIEGLVNAQSKYLQINVTNQVLCLSSFNFGVFYVNMFVVFLFSTKCTCSGLLKFFNDIAHAWWRNREIKIHMVFPKVCYTCSALHDKTCNRDRIARLPAPCPSHKNFNVKT